MKSRDVNENWLAPKGNRNFGKKMWAEVSRITQQGTERKEADNEDEDEENLAEAQGFSFEGYLGLSIGEVGRGECVEGIQLIRREKIGGGSEDILLRPANWFGAFVGRGEKRK